jgi:aspartate/tyrosine/aromatic aminotransferase
VIDVSVDILKISKDAIAASKIYDDVINASIGMFYDEDKSIGGMPVVSKAIRSLPDDKILPYPAVDGGADFKNNVISWVLGKYEDSIRKQMFISACATPGGSGAIASTFAVYAKPGESIFVSDIRWQYERFADRAKLNIFEHKLFNGDGFDMDSFKNRLHELCAIQKRVIVIINDPCHNPTGFTLSEKEFEQILDTMNELVENEIVFIYDLAYLDFSHEADNRKKITYLPKLKNHVMTILSFSGSKTFGAYGLRLGAAIGLSHDESMVKDFHKKYVNEARGSWSATPTVSIELLNHFSKKENKDEFLKGLDHINTLVQKRSASFIKQAREIGLKTHPFRSGFYTVVLTPNPEVDYLKLADHHIYAVPMSGGIRLALCSLSVMEIDGLPQKIKKILNL